MQKIQAILRDPANLVLFDKDPNIQKAREVI